MQIHHVDCLVVGAGIVGLSHALACARRGLKVVVFDRHTRAMGASVRNFGMVWPIGQPLGQRYERALASRRIWLELAQAAGFHAEETGSLHLAYRADEMAVLEEFVGTRQQSHPVEVLTPEQVIAKSSAVVSEGLLGALWSGTEVIIDPREAIAKLPDYLSKTYGVEFRFGTTLTGISDGVAFAGQEKWIFEHGFICGGADLETLYPQHYAESGITKVKLQMLRTVPQPNAWRLGPALCGGLTLTHYAAFADCPSLAALKDRIALETPHFPQWGIHVMVSQNGLGELIIGDSHEYGMSPDPFDRADLNRYILDYLKGFARPPSLEIAATWHGIYAKLPGATEWVIQPEPQVTIINALGGAGMTLALGTAEEIVADVLTASR